SMTEAIKKGETWLAQNAKTFQAETDTGLSFKDNFVEFLILEATGNWNLIDLPIPEGKWNYFGGKAVITTDPYPEDIDTSCIANTVMKPTPARAHKLLDEILACENEDGIIPLYFDVSRPRVCIEVCANVCTFFYTYGRGSDVRKTFDLVYATLKKRDFGVKRYYFTPEPLLYYVCRLVNSSKAPELENLKAMLKECVSERLGVEGNSVCLAIRIFLCVKLGIPHSKKDLERLVAMQEEDGSFGVGWYYNFGRSGVKIGHRGLTAALAVEAL
ncbi:hypothetical protein M011DRAFT_374562, partial [Sporormia fimetaria CBS 119925]